MKKNFILGVFLIGLFAISLVSAGWFSDLFNRPPSVTGNVINSKGMDLDLNKLSEGVQLSKGMNYWFIWKDSETSVSDVMSNLNKADYYYVYEYNSKTRKYSYWYGDSDKRNKFEKFSNGNQYAFYMRKAGVLKMENSDNFHSADYDRDGKIQIKDNFLEIIGKGFVSNPPALILSNVEEHSATGMIVFNANGTDFARISAMKDGPVSQLTLQADRIQLRGNGIYLSDNNNTYYGEGNAYACLDKYGKLFRSNTPCR